MNKFKHILCSVQLLPKRTKKIKKIKTHSHIGRQHRIQLSTTFPTSSVLSCKQRALLALKFYRVDFLTCILCILNPKIRIIYFGHFDPG